MSVQSPEPDHIILGTRDLDEGVAYMENLSGYRAEFAGAHSGRGTRNAILKLGYHSYLEILAPDPNQTELTWYKELPTLDGPLLVGWSVPVKDIDHYAAKLRARGTSCIGPEPGRRTKPNGEVFKWKTLRLEDDKLGILPFYIEWDSDSPHPSTEAPGACLLERMHNSGQLLRTPPPGPEFHRVEQPNFPPAQLHVFIAGRFGEFELKSRAVPSEAWTKLPPSP
jgi:Glyoxalase-like domain